MICRLPYAHAALRFLYTGDLEGMNTVETLLRVRRMAEYLQIEGCCEACDEAIAELVAAGSAADTNIQQQSAAGGGGGALCALSRVMLLYGNRALLRPCGYDTWGPGGDSVDKVLHACRQQLVAHSGLVAAEGPLTEGGPSLGELLAWSFRDAPSLLSHPLVRSQMEALPLAAVEALLRSDGFATDDEASVLLLVAVWLRAYGQKRNYSSRDRDLSEARARLCKAVRLSQLSSTFLHVVLPCLTWVPITSEEHRFLCDYTHAAPARRARMAAAAGGLYECGSAGYTAAVRQKLPSEHGTRSYNWCVTATELQTALTKPTSGAQLVIINGKFVHGAERVVSYGLEWHPYIQYDKGKAEAAVHLACSWPAALQLPYPEAIVAMAHLGGCGGGLELCKRSNGGGNSNGQEPPPAKVARQQRFAHDDFVLVGGNWGAADALPLQVNAPPRNTARAVAAIAAVIIAAAAAAAAAGRMLRASAVGAVHAAGCANHGPAVLDAVQR